MKREAEIYCPLCAWRPKATDRWWCHPGCGAEWNTFWTRGLCPGCGHQWLETACLRCQRMSPHESWYHYPDDHEGSSEDSETYRKEIETA
jgi:hypothetical protein